MISEYNIVLQNVRYHLTRPVVQKVEIHVTVASGSFVKCPVDPGNRHHVVTVVLVDTVAVTLSVAGRGGSGNQIKHGAYNVFYSAV